MLIEFFLKLRAGGVPASIKEFLTLIEALAKMEAGSLICTPQDESRASYAPMLEKEHGWIDWSRARRDPGTRRVPPCT